MNFSKRLNSFILLSIFFAMPCSLISQKRFSISILANAEASLMHIKNSKALEFDSNTSEKGGIGIGYTLGIQPQYFITKKIFLRSGVTYQVSTYKSLLKDLFFINHVKGKIILKNTTQSIGIPIELGRSNTTKNQKLVINYGLGIIYNCLINKQATGKIKYSDGETSTLHMTKNTLAESNFSVYIFGGIIRELNAKLSIGIEPYIKYTPNKFVTAIYESSAKTLCESGINFRLTLK